jgi:hypothetical protein
MGGEQPLIEMVLKRRISHDDAFCSPAYYRIDCRDIDSYSPQTAQLYSSSLFDSVRHFRLVEIINMYLIIGSGIKKSLS